LGVYLGEYGDLDTTRRLSIRQGEQVGRPSELRVEARREDGAWRARVGGGVHIVGGGAFEL
ncbi:MAG TPA: hypothetical protein VLZ09_04485, partial [Gaiellaceae bacterium]|nr:hypothetical protein [Gaiellaceae bacterium]